MKILNEIHYIGGVGADYWIGSGFKDAFEEYGHEFFWFTPKELEKRIAEVRPDIVMTSQSMLKDVNAPVFERARRQGTKIVLRVDAYFDSDPEVAKNLAGRDFADIYYGEVEDPHMDRFRAVTRKPYVIIPNAAHHRYHKPSPPVKKYECDIVFMGANLPLKRDIFKKILFPLRKKYRVRLYGPGWTLKDGVLRSIVGASRLIGAKPLTAWIGKQRIQVPREEESSLYSSAKICVNIHERTEAIKEHVILNERTFKVPACGGFELCDYVPPLRRYFAEDEVVMADEKNGSWVDDWFRKIDYYMSHPEERAAIRKRGTARALKEHTYLNRVQSLLRLLER